MTKINGNEVARRIDRMMHALNLNQKQLADHLQITQPAVSKYLQGRVPPAEILLHLSVLAGVSMEWILTGQTRPALTGVAEPSAVYEAATQLQKKLDRLPPRIKEDFDHLIDSLSGYF